MKNKNKKKKMLTQNRLNIKKKLRTSLISKDIQKNNFINENQKNDNHKSKRKQILINCIKYLVSNGINIQNYIKKYPFPSKPFEIRGSEEFFEAIKFNNCKLVEQALELNPEYANQYDYMKQTPFHWAVKLGYDDILTILLKYSKFCNIYDKKNRTPLYLAALNNQKKCVEILLEKGGNPYITDINGKKPEDVTTNPRIKLILQNTNEKHFSEINNINNGNPSKKE